MLTVIAGSGAGFGLSPGPAAAGTFSSPVSGSSGDGSLALSTTM
jgi:hypothetical protein